MHKLINPEMVESIRTTGKTDPNLPDRSDILDEYGLKYDQPAKNLIITGCQILPGMPHIVKSLARILDSRDFDYTFLSKEYCCGNYLYRPAIAARDNDAMDECRVLSKEFTDKNIQQMKELGAERIIIFCSPCFPIYRAAFPEENILFYPEAIRETMEDAKWEGRIDYYAGCYKLHKKFSDAPMDLKSTQAVFKQVQGLDVNSISAPECCFKPGGLSHMIDNVETETMVHICTGCYGQAKGNMPDSKKVNIMMLPEFVEKSMGLV